VVLGQGRTLAQIVPQTDADWRFLAGPFTVQVTGTEFDLSWDPDEQVLELALHQGSVALSGPTVKGARLVRKGEFVRLQVPRTSASSDVSKQKQKDGAPGEEKSAPRGADLRTADGQDGASTTKVGQADDKSWQNLLAAGKRDEALTALERAGAKSALQNANAGDLWTLSRAARVAGKASLARDALLALRSRHGTRDQTAYLLGKVHADQLHENAEAIRWFETYLNEAPGGALAEQALGRLVELQTGTKRGERAARRYLETYPRGSYADFARSSLR
jgi:hypothetical protein